MKTMFRVQAIFWYNSEHHTTRRNDFATAESHFCRLLEIHTPKLPKFKIWGQKMLFQKPMRLGFWVVEFVLCIFYLRYAYEKQCLKSRLSFNITQSIIQRVKWFRDNWEPFLSTFRNSMLRNGQSSKSSVLTIFCEVFDFRAT